MSPNDDENEGVFEAMKRPFEENNDLFEVMKRSFVAMNRSFETMNRWVDENKARRRMPQRGAKVSFRDIHATMGGGVRASGPARILHRQDILMQSHQEPSSSSAQADSKADATHIYPYEPLQQLAPDLWQMKGSLKLPVIPRYMTVYRLPDRRLVLYSVIAMEEDGMRALEALGTPAIMVIPHDRHQMDAPFYKRRYPDLRVVAPEPEKPREVPIDGGLDILGPLGIRAYALPGATYDEAVLELPIPDGVALCTCELLGNLTPAPTGVVGAIAKVVGPPGGGFGVNRAVRWREVRDRPATRDWLAHLAERTDIRMILMGHGSPVTGDIPAALRHAAEGA